MLGEAGIRGASVLDVGSGRGRLAVRLLRDGAARATGIDLSPNSVEAARLHAEAAGVAERARFSVGNATEKRLERHDVVVLDRVICCFRDLEGLLGATVPAAGRVYAFVLPASEGLIGLWSRIWVGFENLGRRILRRPFRAFVHPVPRIHDELTVAGFAPAARTRRRSWLIAAYQRAPAA